MGDWNYRNASMKKVYGKGVGCATLIISVVILVAAIVFMLF